MSDFNILCPLRQKFWFVWYYVYGVHGFINHERKKQLLMGKLLFSCYFCFSIQR